MNLIRNNSMHILVQFLMRILNVQAVSAYSIYFRSYVRNSHQLETYANAQKHFTKQKTVSQVWTKKGDEVATTNGDNSESDTNVDAYEYSKKLRRERSIQKKESSESRLRKSPSSKPPSTVLCSSSSVAAKPDGNESKDSYDPNFEIKMKRRSPSQSSRTTTTSSTTYSKNTPSKKRRSITCEACFRKDIKIADLRTKCAQLKGDRDALREKQLLVHRITSVDTEFLHSSERSGYKK